MTGTLVPRTSLRPQHLTRMLELLDANFSQVTREQFERDLSEKNWVILIENENLPDGPQRIVGFSTLRMYRSSFRGEPIAVVYSGDTIVDRAAWGSSALPRTWIQSVWKIHRAEFPGLPLWWLLLTSGYRTYRFLSVFWRTFYPNPLTTTPPEMQRLADQLARERFGDRYQGGIVPLHQPLKDHLLQPPPVTRPDPHIAFFLQKNPGHVHGDELVCLCPLTKENLTSAGERMVG